MPVIDLDNSRPFDVHKWSHHPESNNFVEPIWENYVSRHYQNRGVGKRPKSDPKIQLKVLLLDLYVCWREDPNQYIGVGLSKRNYKAGSRYNKLHISEVMIKLVHVLADSGQLEVHKGIEGSGRQTRIKAVDLLADLFLHSALSLFDIYNHRDKEVILLNETIGKPIEYDDNDHLNIVDMRTQLKAYNELLLRSFIDRPDLDEPIISSNNASQTTIRIGHSHSFVRRIFYRGSWELGGRFHGGWWQRINENQRQLIHINNQNTTEVDYKSLHINLLYGLNNIQPPDDPYDIQPLHDLFEAEGDRMQLIYNNRTIVKKLILYAINGQSEKSAFQAFRKGQTEGSIFKRLSNKNLKRIVDAFIEKNPAIRNYLFTDIGVELMNMDGKLTAMLISHFTERTIPILTIHDSYIVQQEHAEELKSQMQIAVSSILGNDIQIPVEENNIFIRKIFDGENEEFDTDYVELPEDHPTYQPTEGYLARLSFHRRWLNRL
jgi:hypothetical protein